MTPRDPDGNCEGSDDDRLLAVNINRGGIDPDNVTRAGRGLWSALSGAGGRLRDRVRVAVTRITLAILFALALVATWDYSLNQLYVYFFDGSIGFLSAEINRMLTWVILACLGFILSTGLAVLSWPLARGAYATPPHGSTAGMTCTTKSGAGVTVNYHGDLGKLRRILDLAHLHGVELRRTDTNITDQLAACYDGASEHRYFEIYINEEFPRAGLVRGEPTEELVSGRSDAGLPVNEVIEELSDADTTVIMQVVVAPRTAEAAVYQDTITNMREGKAVNPPRRALRTAQGWYDADTDTATRRSASMNERIEALKRTEGNRLHDVCIRGVVAGDTATSRDIANDIAAAFNSISPGDYTVLANVYSSQLPYSQVPGVGRMRERLGWTDHPIHQAMINWTVKFGPQHFTYTRSRPNIPADAAEVMAYLLVSGDGSNLATRAIDATTIAQTRTEGATESQRQVMRPDDSYDDDSYEDDDASE